MSLHRVPRKGDISLYHCSIAEYKPLHWGRREHDITYKYKLPINVYWNVVLKCSMYRRQVL
jgi:hypothetical protein